MLKVSESLIGFAEQSAVSQQRVTDIARKILEQYQQLKSTNAGQASDPNKA